MLLQILNTFSNLFHSLLPLTLTSFALPLSLSFYLCLSGFLCLSPAHSLFIFLYLVRLPLSNYVDNFAKRIARVRPEQVTV